MYKNPELSAEAKNLRRELKILGLSLSHAQALELAAKSHGARTLHVAQATKSKQGVDISGLALKQAAKLMFDSLGRFEDNVLGLLESIRAGFLREATEGSRAVEAAMHDLFGTEGAPKVSVMFEPFRLDELPEQFALIQASLTQSLVDVTGAPADSTDSCLYLGPMLDWRVQEGAELADLPEHHRTSFEVRVQRSGYQLYLDVSKPHDSPEDLDGTDQLSLFVEVNEGRPCVHISNARYGDQVLTVFATTDGLYLRPDATHLHVSTGIPSGAVLAQLQEELTTFEGRPLPDRNHAFIEAKLVE